MSSNIPNIPKEKFEFVQLDKELHDEKFETKPVGYFLDAWYRFRKNKGSVVAACIIGVLIIYSILAPIIGQNKMADVDMFYAYAKPKNAFFAKYGLWTGYEKTEVNQQMYDYYSAIPNAIVKVDSVKETNDGIRKNKFYKIVLDTYAKTGFQTQVLSQSEYERLLKYQEETGIQILYPLIDTKNIKAQQFKNNSNFWYKANIRGLADRDANGNLIANFKKDKTGTSADGYKYVNSEVAGQYEVRVKYDEFYNFKNGHYPQFLFGCDGFGQDVFVRLAGGGRFSLILGISVASINILIGVFIGALEGYYGGMFDLYMERFKEILGAVPFMVVATLFQMHLARQVGVVGCLIFAFILTGWIGVSGRTRTQFYRFKGQEYVLAARTLGAKDGRIIFKHILPNAVGTLITSCVLMIPGVIFSESFLSYLGIINLQSTTMTSIGTMLSNGQAVLSVYPHIIAFPSIFISLLEISFNMFGNGLRDAFNPSLRGAE